MLFRSQSVPLLCPEPPLVGTGLEQDVARECGEELTARESGVVQEVDACHIKIKTKKGRVDKYKLEKFNRSNQYTCSNQKPQVSKGALIKKGDILANGSGICDGRLSLGRNVLIAFLSFRGNNFEDSITFSEKLVKSDSFSSIRIDDFTCDIRETKLGPEITTCDIPNVAEEKLKDLDEEGIVRVGAEVGSGDILVGKISPGGERNLTAEER